MDPGSQAGWSLAADEVVANLGADPVDGLTSSEAAERLRRFGPNQIEAVERRHALSLLLAQFRSIVVLLLVAACGLAFAFGDHVEGLAILAVIIANSTIGFVTEWRATRSMEALRDLGRVETVVLRDGIPRHQPADELVPGDIVILEGGDLVAADMRLVEAAKLQVDESSLTGESLPARKEPGVLPPETPLMDRRNMLFKGASLTRGSCKAIVVATGMSTELGHISELVIAAEGRATPLQDRLNRLGGVLAWSAIGLAVLIAATSIATGRDLFLSIEVGIALAVAAIPEGLPIVATIALARGMHRMAKRNALISRLAAVETLGATSVILTDKTGTLTENRMQVVALQLADTNLEADGVTLAGISGDVAVRVDELLETAILCTNASLEVDESDDIHATGDPTEVALLEAGLRRNIHRDALRARSPEIAEFPFDPDLKLMATMHEVGDGFLVAVKGAPENVIRCCTAERMPDADVPLGASAKARWLERAETLGRHGLRTLAVAARQCNDKKAAPFEELTLLGIAGLEDPPRSGVREALDRCQEAGIKVIMITGDHAATARNIATEIGLAASNASDDEFMSGADIDRLLESPRPEGLIAGRVFSRVSPEQKLRLIDFFQQRGSIVAMTGDGVNDAPALKKADIGVAMGIRGTAVAREAASMVLQDDDFGTIVDAVSQGRTIFENIRKFVFYLLSCNISEVLVVALAILGGAPLPLLPLHILFLNLVTDVFPALALGVGEGSDRLMHQRPRSPSEHVLTRHHWIGIVLFGLVISATVLSAMALAIFGLGFDPQHAITVSFCTLALAQLWHVFNMRSDLRSPVDNEVSRNPWVWGAVLLCIALILGSIYLELPARLLQLRHPGIEGWAVILSMSILPLLAAPVVRTLARRF